MNAQYNLGALMLSGKTGQSDPRKAIKWIEQAANKGHVDVAYSLGLLYYTGSKEFKQDFSRAYKAFESAAKKVILLLNSVWA